MPSINATLSQKEKEKKASKELALRNKLLPRVFQYKLIREEKMKIPSTP
jgi:hypothetical protein